MNNEELLKILLELKSHKHCPYFCNDEGSHISYDPEGNEVGINCNWCHSHPNSLFNIRKRNS